MKLIVGLGNPGSEFNGTPHNVGFGVVDMLAEDLHISFAKKKKNALYAETIVDDEKVMLIKPQTYMNNSGDCVFSFAKMFKLKMTDIIVILDDIELTPGLVRVRPQGTPGTHNGLKNICYRLGTTEFARIRVGVGAPADEQDLADFVLSKIDENTMKNVIVGMEKAKEFAKDFIHNKIVATTA